MCPENKKPFRVTIAQFEGIDYTPSLPLAAGVLVATAKIIDTLREQIFFDIVVPRISIKEVLKELRHCDIVGFSLSLELCLLHGCSESTQRKVSTYYHHLGRILASQEKKGGSALSTES